MSLFLGVDGGQSSTVALIADETGRVLGSGRGAPCYHVARAIGDSLGEACQQAGLRVEDVAFEAACLGFSGGTADKDAYTREFIRSNFFKITHDAEIALTGATAGAPGIIVIAGTGSIAFGRNADGRFARAGGWGYIFGDEGGAFDLVRQALRAVLKMEEGWGPATFLRSGLLERTGAAGGNELMHDWHNRLDRPAVAALAPLIDEAAQAGDAVAWEILVNAGRELAALVSALHRNHFKPDEIVLVCQVGRVVTSKMLTGALTRSVQSATGCTPTPPLFPPAAGALLEALRMVGNRATLSRLPSIKA